MSAAARQPRPRPLASLRRVRVGSANPPKIQAVRDALFPFTPGAEVEGVSVESGVAEQPLGFAEITAGALNRARAAFASGPCDLAVGYEDGLVEIPGSAERWFNLGCAAVVGEGGDEGIGFSSGFAYPPACAERAAAERAPIGDLFDAFWRERRAGSGGAPSALSEGNVGKLTNGALPRADYARHAVLCALVSFLHPDLYRARGEEP